MPAGLEKQPVRGPFKLAAVVLVGLICCGAVLWLGKLKDPMYRGKPLESWLQDIASNDRNTRLAAEKMFRELGAEVEPALTEAIATREDSSLKLTVMLLAASLHLTKPVTMEAERHWRVGKAFHAMGELGSNAIPSLTRLLENPVNADKAVYALAGIGPKAVASLSLALTNPNLQVRLTAAGALGQFRHESKPAVPNLVTCLKDPNSNLRQASAQALGQIAEMPELAVPALISTLSDSDHVVRMSTAMALGFFGADARSGVPTLVKLETDTDAEVRLAAQSSLYQISVSPVKRGPKQ